MMHEDNLADWTLREKIFAMGAIIAFLIVAAIAGIELISLLPLPAHGENYTFNGTNSTELQNETRLLEQCININEQNASNVLRKDCFMIYGGPVITPLDDLKQTLGIPGAGTGQQTYGGPDQQ
jgi:hypothetical protein